MADQHFAYLISQISHIEPQAYAVQYPEIQYHKLVPVDTSAYEWAKTITHFSTDKVGKPEILVNRANSIPLADVTRDKFEHRIEMAGIGYSYTIEELAQSMMVPNLNLTADKAIACRRSVEEMCDDILRDGNSDLGWDGFIDNSSVPKNDAATTGTGATDAAKREWKNKTAEQIIADINAALLGVYTDSKTVEMADTLLLPPNIWGDVVGKVIDGTAVTVSQFIRENNVYTAKTGMPLDIIEYRGLEDAAAGNTGRMIAYRRHPDVLKFHLPMPFRFMSPQLNMFEYVVPGMFRLGGLEIRRPKAIRYVDGITA